MINFNDFICTDIKISTLMIKCEHLGGFCKNSEMGITRFLDFLQKVEKTFAWLRFCESRVIWVLDFKNPDIARRFFSTTFLFTQKGDETNEGLGILKTKIVRLLSDYFYSLMFKGPSVYLRMTPCTQSAFYAFTLWT